MSFPFSPIDGQTWTNPLGTQYRFDSTRTAWLINSQAVIVNGITGVQGLTGPAGAGFTGLQGIQYNSVPVYATNAAAVAALGTGVVYALTGTYALYVTH